MWCIRPWVKPTVLIVTLLTLVYIAWGSVYDPEALWAPGHLSRYHADIVTCDRCHEAFVGASNNKCLACHTLQQFQLRSPTELHHVHQKIIDQERPCMDCHTEHRGVLASITIGALHNPHGEFVFRATSSSSCSDCHMMGTEKSSTKPMLLQNSTVRHLIEEGEGAHRPGHFSNCLKCHIGGQLEVEEDDDDEEEVD